MPANRPVMNETGRQAGSQSVGLPSSALMGFIEQTRTGTRPLLKGEQEVIRCGRNDSAAAGVERPNDQKTGKTTTIITAGGKEGRKVIRTIEIDNDVYSSSNSSSSVAASLRRYRDSLTTSERKRRHQRLSKCLSVWLGLACFGGGGMRQCILSPPVH